MFVPLYIMCLFRFPDFKFFSLLFVRNCIMMCHGIIFLVEFFEVHWVLGFIFFTIFENIPAIFFKKIFFCIPLSFLGILKTCISGYINLPHSSLMQCSFLDSIWSLLHFIQSLLLFSNSSVFSRHSVKYYLLLISYSIFSFQL